MYPTKFIGTENKNGIDFVKEVAKYYMDFLETDFHKRKNPKRCIQFRNKNNLLIGINLNKYPKFCNLVWKTIKHSFNKNTLNKIQKGVYRANIPKNILDAVKLQVEKITDDQISKIIQLIAGKIKQSVILHNKDYDKALNTSIEAIIKILEVELVLPFINIIEKPLANLNLVDENSIYLMKEELTTILFSLLENKISEIIKLLISKEIIDISEQLKEIFDLSDIKITIHSFYENLQVKDLFTEIYEMERNKTILDQQELYLYFCDINFNNMKFPIFYISFGIQKQNDLLEIEFDSQVYINKKAIEYIVQEYNQKLGKKGQLKKITERIIYLSQHKNDFLDFISETLNEITNFFELDKSISICNTEQQIAKSNLVRVSNNCYLALFDKSDEALVNDYEEILRLLMSSDNVLTDAFNKLIDSFINKNPIPYNPIVEEEWDNTKTIDRLVFSTPIPLNSEQLQILAAIRKKDCKYIIVEGPPGTGKSHTITAVIFDSILKNQSVLVLSDKKEALDVVEDKITETMNKARIDKNFQNPILRLGKTGSTYSQILATTAINNIKTHYRAVKKKYTEIESNIEKLCNTLKEDLTAEILAYEEIDLSEIHELLLLELYCTTKNFPINIDEILNHSESVIEFVEFRRIFLLLKDEFIINLDENEKKKILFELLNFSIDEFTNITNFQKYLQFLDHLTSSVEKLKKVYTNEISLLSTFTDFDKNSLEILERFIISYEREKNRLFGYFFKKNKIKNLDEEFRKSLQLSSTIEPHTVLVNLKKIFRIFQFSKEQEKQLEEKYKINFDYLKFIHRVINDESFLIEIDKLKKIEDELKFLKSNLLKYPDTIKKLEIDLSSLKTLCSNKLVEISDSDFDSLIRFIDLKQKIYKQFKNIPSINYAKQKKDIESLVTTQMTFLLDGRLIDFYENNKATAIALRDIIRTKQKFPKNEFLKLREAFPCILAGIRDYSEYIPLEPEIFDLVIIDEASQVSIAQAFPALLRAKKVLILGDKKQFSNVKTAQARSDTNREYLNYLRDCFIKCFSDKKIELEKFKKFDIKTSILEFFESIANYNIQLLKHFRGYKEIISYSNKFFYDNSLQVMKIRGKAIDDVIKFSFIKHDGKKDIVKNTNLQEAEFIISKLKELKEFDTNQTVGIITPHTNQQKLLVELINKIPEKDYFYNRLKLKIMTFDTCQGEERDIIFYSMVATEENDQLWGVFIKDLNNVNLEEDGKIKAQRLNVGFSRAKETIHFVLSKQIDKYNGSIGDAIKHFYLILEEAKKERSIIEVDAKSKMEPEVMNWFYQTDFWKKNKDSIEFIPQFELGKYLKQLDKTYIYPNYKVDFLLVYKDETKREHKIIIEYDGFREHFKNVEEINKNNYQKYYNDSDVYRQKVLESYGYKFLRINKFNVGNDPISTLNNRIALLVENGVEKNNVVDYIHNTIKGLKNNEMKECPKCKEIRDYNDFRDPNLSSGYGRFCCYCKGYKLEEKPKGNEDNDKISLSNKLCPKCGSKMVLRKGRYGKFYGCSKFPYCRGTRQYE